MKGSTRIAKGRIEEAAGALAGNGKLRTKGQMNQALGHVKQGAKKVADKVAKQLGK
ncbi:MAG TPA: CsbD family protein [Verrucomicrobia bacterium]|nr:CsbD family protein [Verrucomicrobiota bacterium]